MRVEMKTWALAVVALLMGSAAAQAALTIRVSIDVDDPTLEVGQTTTASLKAFVDGGGADEGIFTYDLKVILADSAVLEVVPGSVTRIGIDPDFDAPGENMEGDIGPDGIEDVAGGYSDTNVGIGSPATLFTFQLRGKAAGATTVTPGPDTDVYGFDFLLYSTTTEQILRDYQLGTTVSVTETGDPGGAIPEPITAGLWGLSLLAAGAAFGRRPVR